MLLYRVNFIGHFIEAIIAIFSIRMKRMSQSFNIATRIFIYPQICNICKVLIHIETSKLNELSDHVAAFCNTKNSDNSNEHTSIMLT